jgi:hypothetical protein
MKKLVVAVLLVSSLAHARPRSLKTAYTLSGVGAGGSALLVVGAFLLPPHSGDISYPMLWSGLGTGVLTPSLGNFYAGKYLTVGMGIRVVAGGFAAYVATSQQQEHQCSDSSTPKVCKEITNTGMTLLGVAAIVFIGGAAYDFKTLPDDIDAYNAKHAFKWAPMVTPAPSGPGALLGIGGEF